MIDPKTISKAGAALSTAAGAFTSFVSATQGGGGSPDAGTYSLIITVLGVLIFIVGVTKLRPEAMVGGLILLVLSAPLGALLATSLANGRVSGSSKEGAETTTHPLVKPNIGEKERKEQKEVWRHEKVPKEVAEGESVEGKYEYKQHTAWPLGGDPWGLQLVVEYADGTYRVIPKPTDILQSLLLPHSLIDLDVNGKPKEIKLLRVYLVPRKNLGYRSFCYELQIFFNERVAYRLEDCATLPKGKYIEDYRYLWIANVTADQLEKYVLQNNTVMKVKIRAFVPFKLLGQEGGSMYDGTAELVFHVGKTISIPEKARWWDEYRRKYNPNNELWEECDGSTCVESLLISGVFVDQNTGINLQTILIIMQIMFYAVIIYSVLRRK